ncbi:MAG: papain-like cysteine protease family protein [Phycisphaerales bacterium JB065]
MFKVTSKLIASAMLCLGASFSCGCVGNTGPVEINAEAATVTELGEQAWRVEIDDAPMHYEWQDTPDRCWAASIQMLYKIRGDADVPDEQVLVDEVMRRRLMMPEHYREQAQKAEILSAMALDKPELLNTRVVVPSLITPQISSDGIVYEVSSGEPVLVGVSNHPSAPFGHVMVVYGVEYKRIKNGDVNIVKLREQSERIRKFEAGEKVDSNGLIQGVGDAVESLWITTKGIFSADLSPRFEITKVYLLDPILGLENDGDTDGIFVMDGKEFMEELDFAASRGSALAVLRAQADWVDKHDSGPGIYIQGLPTSGPLEKLTTSSVIDDPELNEAINQSTRSSR